MIIVTSANEDLFQVKPTDNGWLVYRSSAKLDQLLILQAGGKGLPFPIYTAVELQRVGAAETFKKAVEMAKGHIK